MTLPAAPIIERSSKSPVCLSQLLTVCAEPLLRVWDVESGRLVYQIGEPHDTCEVSAVALDPSGYRLASAAIDGALWSNCGTWLF